MGLIGSVSQTYLKELIPCEYRITVFANKGLYVEGVRCIRSFSPGEVLLGLKKSCLKIVGSGLYIQGFSGQDAVVCGEVRIIERIPC